MDIDVICSHCGAICPYVWENGRKVWKWEGTKCPSCGAEAWAAHDTSRDWRSGRLLTPDSQF